MNVPAQDESRQSEERSQDFEAQFLGDVQYVRTNYFYIYLIV